MTSPSSQNIIYNAARASPEKNVFMLGHIGGIPNDSNGVAANDQQLDHSEEYTREQKDIIDNNKKTLYQRKQHDETFDLPQTGYNAIQNHHPLGINMIASHSDRGFDYRDFPEELEKDRISFDPYTEYLHKNGLIGKNKSRYKTQYIDVNSAYRTKKPVSKTSLSVKLDNNPLVFSGNELRIYLSDTSSFSPNDKITLSGIVPLQVIVRSIVTDDYGVLTNYFLLQEGIQYMTVSASTNMDINAAFTPDIKDIYNDIKVKFTGFKGDKKTVWYFDTRIYLWEFVNIIDPDGDPAYNFRLTENVHGVTSASAGNPESGQVRLDMLIAEFQIDRYGNVYAISSGIPYNIDDIRWTEPPISAGLGTPPVQVPGSYYTDSVAALTGLNLYNNPPTLPTTIYNVMNYFQQVQNVIRPIFLNKMSDVVHRNFTLRYAAAGTVYQDSVRIVVPEATKISTVSSIGNVPLNLLNSTLRMFLTSADVEKDLGIYDPSTSTATDTPSPDKFYIELNNPFVKRVFEFADPMLSGALLITVYDEPKSDITITYDHYGGVPINLINTEYPIGFTSIDGFKYVVNVVTNSYISVILDRIGFYSGNFGGQFIYLGLIEDISAGYPQPNRYTIDLQRDYTNIVMIKIITSAFPMTQKIFMDGISGGYRNNRFYWQNMDDGDTIYMIELEPGNYQPAQFKIVFEDAVSKIMRVNDKTLTPIQNKIIVNIDEATDGVTFSNYNEYVPGETLTYLKQTTLSEINIICTSTIITNSNIGPLAVLLDPEDAYYQYPTGDYFKNFPNSDIACDAIRVKIYHPKNNLTIGTTIIIKGSLNYESIPAKYLNGAHIVTRVGANDYDILLSGVNTDSTLAMISGGNEITILTPNMFRIFFSYPDTFGSILGFRDVGDISSVTPYAAVITNDVLYEGEVLQSVLDTMINDSSSSDTTSTGTVIRNALNFFGPPYILIVLQDILNAKGIGPVKDFFYRIDLNGELGKYVYKSYVDMPIFYNEPIRHINTLSIGIFSPDGNYYAFNGADHSFVLEIVTYDDTPEGTNIRKAH